MFLLCSSDLMPRICWGVCKDSGSKTNESSSFSSLTGVTLPAPLPFICWRSDVADASARSGVSLPAPLPFFLGAGDCFCAAFLWLPSFPQPPPSNLSHRCPHWRSCLILALFCWFGTLVEGFASVIGCVGALERL